MLIQPNIVTKAPGALQTSVTGNAVGAFLSTPQPNFGKVEMASAVSGSTYDNAVATFTPPASSNQTLLLYGPGSEDPNLLKIVPYANINNATSPTFRVVGWNAYPWSATNLVAFSETFATTGAVAPSTNWVDSNITRSTTLQTDPLGGTTALRITASAGNATITNAVASPALSSAARAFSIYLRRVTGSGNIQWTMDGGTTWTTQAITASWVRYTFTATSATSVGIRIVTSGDAIEVWGAQVEAGQAATQYGRTTTGTASVSQALYVPTVLADFTTLAYHSTSIPSGDFDGSRRHFFSNIGPAGGTPTPSSYAPGTSSVSAGVAAAIVDTVGSQFVTVQFKSGSSAIYGAFWSVL